MTRAYEDEEMPLPLLQSRALPARRRARIEAEDDMPLRRDYRAQRPADRLRPGTAGALMGLVAGAAGLGVVHAMHLPRISDGIMRLATRLGLPPDAAVPMAYLAAAVGGALIGAAFAALTKHLRRSFAALVVWALVFFVSLTMLVLAVSAAYGHGLGVSMAPAILLASAAYAVIVSFQLPLRRRSVPTLPEAD
ncbi:MAG: hypothetical protein JWO86_4573 [Myxococcaceae bacterium]|jgi:hypothetical protein|nr:hypothetical protein [Myxococcaceae bacterium]MEA2752386.1 hypothetical protein [Myxococcales bacterium]